MFCCPPPKENFKVLPYDPNREDWYVKIPNPNAPTSEKLVRAPFDAPEPEPVEEAKGEAA